MVKEIFSTITEKYDFLNHFLSLRRDITWRRFAVSKMRFFKTYRFLDVATGTSDLAIETVLNYPYIQVVGLDFVKEMLDQGRRKILKMGLSAKIDLTRGDALDIPLYDEGFDVAAIAFGIRNIPDKMGALMEMVRTVTPGGQVMALEMTLPQTRYFRALYHIYLNIIMPYLARTFSHNPKAYYYLGDSIMNFPTTEGFTLMMTKAGLTDVESYSLTSGICRLFVGRRGLAEG